MKIKTNQIFILFLLFLSCSVTFFCHIAPEEGLITEQIPIEITSSTRTNPYTNLPTYTPTQRSITSTQIVTSTTALPLVNTTAKAYTVHRSNTQVHSIGGGFTSNTSHNHIATHTPTYTPAYNHIATPQVNKATQAHTPRMLAYNPQPIMQRAPGSVDDNYQGWIDEYYGSGYGYGDLTGLKNWWESKYGDGATPDIFNEFYGWATETQVPIADGLLFSLLLATLYALRKKRNI